MKIVAVVEKAYRLLTPTGGAETMIADLMEYLAGIGWDCQVLVTSGIESRVLVNGVSVVRTQNKDLVHSIASSADVILTHLGGTPRARALGRSYAKPVAQLIHNTNEYSVGFLGDGCDFAIYNSQWVSEFHGRHASDPIIRSWTGGGSSYIRSRTCRGWPSIVVRPPVMTEYKDISMRNGAITLINLIENKGINTFLSLAKRNPKWNFMGVIGGYSPESQFRGPTYHNVYIHDHVQDIDEIFKQTSILIVPSRYESYGRVAVEAMGRGVPVIASSTPGLKECLGYNHLIRERDDIPGWEQAIEWVWANYEETQDIYLERYNQLYDQSRSELALFADAMEGLVNQWH